MKGKAKVALGFAILLAATQASATDPLRGQAKSTHCVACHGLTGVSPNPTFPHLAGQNATYLAVQLEHFRSGERYHALMTPVAQSLTDEDIKDLSAYFSGIGPLAGAQR